MCCRHTGQPVRNCLARLNVSDCAGCVSRSPVHDEPPRREPLNDVGELAFALGPGVERRRSFGQVVPQLPELPIAQHPALPAQTLRLRVDSGCASWSLDQRPAVADQRGLPTTTRGSWLPGSILGGMSGATDLLGSILGDAFEAAGCSDRPRACGQIGSWLLGSGPPPIRSRQLAASIGASTIFRRQLAAPNGPRGSA
jgi:hypothetical protein